MKKKILATIMMCVALALPLSANAMTPEQARPTISAVYPSTMVVIDICRTTDEVVLEDSNGYLWSFFGTEDWCIGDVASVLMNNNGTPEIFDDTILLTHYCGFAIERR